jgi:single-strand DNA-binding protein
MSAKSLNKVQLIGNLGREVEIRYTPNGTPVAKVSLATNENFKNKKGEWVSRTEWHNLILWSRLAEIAGEFLKKGSKIYVEGRLATRTWDDRTHKGVKHYMTEIVVSDLIMLDGKAKSSPAEEPEYQESASDGHAPIGMDEDIPF